MSLAKGLAVSVVCGGIGAAVWAGLTYATGWQLGLVSIVVGGAAGFGMAAGSGGRGGSQAGLIAAVVALVSILAGNFAVAQVLVRGHINDVGLTEDDGVDVLARQIYEDMTAAGDSFDDDEWDGDWPVIVRYKAETRWYAMSPAERRELLAAQEELFREEAEGAAPLMGLLAFLWLTLHWKSLVVIGLGVSTAYKIASTDMKAEAEAGGMAAEEFGPAVATAPAAAAGPRPRGGAGDAALRDDDEESAGGGYRLPAMREPAEDNLPSIEEIMRKHAAARGEADGGGERSEAA